MPNLLNEWGYKDSAKKWAKLHGEMPNMEDPEFKAFHKQYQAKANSARKAKTDIDPDAEKNMPKYVEKVLSVAEGNINALPKELKNTLQMFKKRAQASFLQAIIDSGRIQQPWLAWMSLLQQAVSNTFHESKTETVLLAFQEAISPTTDKKYPWLRPLLNTRLAITEEDDAPVDAQANTATPVDNIDAPVDVDNNTNDTADDEDFDLDSLDFPDESDNNSSDPIDDLSGGIGGLGGMSTGMPEPQQNGDGAEFDAMGGAAPKEKIMNVFFDDSGDVMKAKVEVKNMDTGEVYYKDISEVDVQ